MTESKKAVFLSYASEDAAAAARICANLRAAGIEVWFDQSELRGGEAWDVAIRKQIKVCALFIPVISRNTHAREEGYFRLEWKLAVDRSYLMTTGKTFLLPVVLDDTRDDDEQVPDRFREVHWTRLPGGETPSAFVERVLRLLSPDATAAVEHAAPSSSAGSAATLMRPSRNPIPLWRSWAALVLTAAVAIIAGVYFAVDRFMLPKHVADSSRTLAPTAQLATPAHSTIPEKSIAVLPFVDMSEKKDQEYFSDGLAEDILGLLAKVPDLHVIARTSSFSFKGKSEDVPTIAQKLHVASVLEGSVRKAGNRLRITTELIRADNGEHLWSETYDRELKDVFAVQDEIAAAVVSALKIRLLPSQHLPREYRTANTDAYNQYLIGRQFYYRGDVDSTRRAIAALEKAVALDASYAPAYSALAINKWSLAIYGGASSVRMNAEALALAEKAVALAPDFADGYSARGIIRARAYDWSGAQADTEKAIALNPRDASAQRRYGQILTWQGRLTEAIAALRTALGLDPLDARSWLYLGAALAGSGQYAAARSAYQRSLEISPELQQAQLFLAAVEVHEGRAQAALQSCGALQRASFRLSCVSDTEYVAGHRQAAQQTLDQLVAGPAGVRYRQRTPRPDRQWDTSCSSRPTAPATPGAAAIVAASRRAAAA